MLESILAGISKKKYKMKIFIIGKSSNLAKHLLKKLENRPDIKVCSISTKKDFNYVDRFEKLKNKIMEFKPNIIFNLSGLTKFNLCEKNVNEAYKINTFFPQKLSNFCEENKIFFIYFSSDAVFSGKKNKLYTVNDVPAPESTYGKSKLLAENLIIQNKFSLIIRLPMLYGKYFNSGFVYESLKKINLKKKIYLFKDVYCSPIDAEDVCNYIFNNLILKKKIQMLLKKKIIHLSNNKRISRYIFIKKLIDSKYIKKMSYRDFKEKKILGRYFGLKSNLKNLNFRKI